MSERAGRIEQEGERADWTVRFRLEVALPFIKKVSVTTFEACEDRRAER